MNKVTVEKLEGNLAKITIEASAEAFEEAVNHAYLKNRGKIQLPGFRKGKAPRKLIEKAYGEGVFYEDAADELVSASYAEAMEDEACRDLDIVARPEIDIVSLGKDQPFVYTATVALKPAVELGQYKGFEIELEPVRVTEAEVDAEVDRVREQNARTITVEDRPVQEGDIAVIDYDGYVDGVAFEGGKGENHELAIGSHSFIDTFEDQLIGANAGDELDVHVTFPEEYHAENLAGKPALFKVKIHEIRTKELPEADDEFAEEVSDFDTLEAYRADLHAKLLERKQKDADRKKRDEILKRAVENAKMDIPAAMIEEQARSLANDYANRLQQQGLSMEMYMKYTGKTMDQVVDQFRDEAKTRIRNTLTLEAIAKAEGITVTDEDLDEEIKNMAESYQMEAEKLKELIGERDLDGIRDELLVRKALDRIAE
ncbi:MAG: trigger factor [Lachnospiraceae bacterium]|nr:trigger factor [Lachnospiraceae bacterium]MBP5255105.1 trigger factor [Lachnospiraceae bacterium]